METNEQTNAPDDSEATEELDTLSATRQRIRARTIIKDNHQL
jgi:hypothetical protein